MMTWQESAAWRPEIEGHSIDILPFFTEIAPRIPQGGTYLEVGVYKGRSFRFMRELRPDLYMIAVDPWTDESVAASHGTGEETFYAFLHDTMDYTDGWLFVRGTIFDVVSRCIPYHRLDLIFLDGDHLYPGVKLDIGCAMKILKPGGILAGHDFAGGNGVEQAVRELVPEWQLSDFDAPLPGAEPGKGRCWWVQL